MAEYTPGPWSMDRASHRWEIIGNDGLHIADVFRYLEDNSFDEGTVGDARLIAAAPDLYEALVTLTHNGPIPQSGTEKRAYQTATLAIAKAEGRQP